MDATLGYRTRPRRSGFIRLFDKTPKGIVCPHFWLLAWADGCSYKCTYCYLIGTFRGKSEPVVFSNLQDLFNELDGWLRYDGNPRLLNTGELTDSLAITDVVMVRLVKLFSRQRKHKLLLLTKSSRVENLLGLEHRGQSIVSFSLNPEKVAERFEVGAPHPDLRLKAAERCMKAGYEVRIRVDPMIPVERWREAYLGLAEKINNLNPERVTLGTLRYYPAVKAFSQRDTSIFKLNAKKSVDGRFRLLEPLRIEMYQLMLGSLRARYVSLCKETAEVVKLLGLTQRCNCVP